MDLEYLEDIDIEDFYKKVGKNVKKLREMEKLSSGK